MIRTLHTGPSCWTLLLETIHLKRFYPSNVSASRKSRNLSHTKSSQVEKRNHQILVTFFYLENSVYCLFWILFRAENNQPKNENGCKGGQQLPHVLAIHEISEMHIFNSSKDLKIKTDLEKNVPVRATW